MRSTASLVLTLTAGLLAGCAARAERTTSIQVDPGITALNFSADFRGVYIKRNGQVERLCAEPTTDVAASTSGGLTLGVGADQLGDTSSDSATALGGRDALVLITRELLFRACELALNTEASYEQSLALYQAALEMIKAIAPQEAGRGPQ
jgi:hypothetical protein